MLKPPSRYLKTAEHHWLNKFDYDGHNGGLIVLQWNPIAGKWSHSGMVGTGIYIIPGDNWEYIAHCPIPEF